MRARAQVELSRHLTSSLCLGKKGISSSTSCAVKILGPRLAPDVARVYVCGRRKIERAKKEIERASAEKGSRRKRKAFHRCARLVYYRRARRERRMLLPVLLLLLLLRFPGLHIDGGRRRERRREIDWVADFPWKLPRERMRNGDVCARI